ncbi:hypothetical protein [Jutongia huaianensis]|uniref:hypothetical protein n=1 Tax=Jutongia huaianensis TaxID=2763668 RepID=UPI002016A5F1|nr:hypothetical protein [Jutongia huaianensis]
MFIIRYQCRSDPSFRGNRHRRTRPPGPLPVTVKRNAYGRQLGSFCTTADLTEIPAFPMVFIRAPYIASVKEPVKVLGTVDDHIVAVQYKHQIGLSFHPELTGDTRIHKYFVDMVRNVI